jgi:hypothetical protein
MGQIIKFKALDKYGFDTQLKPVPASSMIPGWFKDSTPYEIDIDNPKGTNFKIVGGSSNATFKKCTPMLDGLTSGYIIKLWSDVHVEWTDGGPSFSWRTHAPLFEVHGIGSKKITPPLGYSNFVFKYLNTWQPITPKGYSVLVTSPFGYQDLPFRAIPAVIDSDKLTIDMANPMWLKEGFSGIIEKGTPLVQLTPFKRENWESEFDFYKDGEFLSLKEKSFNSTLINHYVKNIWSKKTYR